MKQEAAVAVSIAIGMLTLSVLAQTKQVTLSPGEEVLERQVQGSEVELYTTPGACVLSLRRAGVAGGVAKLNNCETDKPLQVWNPMGAPLRQVLSSLIQTDPRFVWEFQNGVVNLLPATGEPLLLQTRIARFRVENSYRAREALSHLLALDDVRRGMEDVPLKDGIAIIKSLESPHPTAFSVECKDVTLREALNTIARAQGHAVWEYIETHCNGRDDVIIRFQE